VIRVIRKALAREELIYTKQQIMAIE